jgi:hypothetical protein
MRVGSNAQRLVLIKRPVNGMVLVSVKSHRWSGSNLEVISTQPPTFRSAIDRKNVDVERKRSLQIFLESQIPPFRPTHFPCTARHP